MECMCAQTGPRFILSSKRVIGNGVRAHINSKGKIPSPEKFSSEEDQTQSAVSSRTANPTHMNLSIADNNNSKQKVIWRQRVLVLTLGCVWCGCVAVATTHIHVDVLMSVQYWSESVHC